MQKDEFRKFESVSDVARSWMEPVLVVLLFGASIALEGIAPEWALMLARIFASFILLFMWGVNWLNWASGKMFDRLDEVTYMKAYNSQTLLLEKEIELEKARWNTISAIRLMGPDHLEYAKALGDFPTVEVYGNMARWVIGDMSIPVTFAFDWWKVLKIKEGDKLPADHDFKDFAHRDLHRKWNGQVTTALVRMGVVRDPAGPYPARWIVGEKARQAALRDIGFYFALMISEMVLDETADWTGLIDGHITPIKTYDDSSGELAPPSYSVGRQ